MKEKLKITSSTILILITFQGVTQTNFMKQAWQRQVSTIKSNYVTFDFAESSNQLGHNFYTWKQTYSQGNGKIKKSSKRKADLYCAIKDLGIEVETIIQSWPVQDYGVKTIIPFKDLEKSMSIK